MLVNFSLKRKVKNGTICRNRNDYQSFHLSFLLTRLSSCRFYMVPDIFTHRTVSQQCNCFIYTLHPKNNIKLNNWTQNFVENDEKLCLWWITKKNRKTKTFLNINSNPHKRTSPDKLFPKNHFSTSFPPSFALLLAEPKWPEAI